MLKKAMTIQPAITGEGLRRLLSGEYLDAVARDLRARSVPELQILFDETARRIRRHGLMLLG